MLLRSWCSSWPRSALLGARMQLGRPPPMLRAPPSPACVALPLLQPQALFARGMSVAYPLVPWRCPVLPVHARASHIPCLPAGPVQVPWHPAPAHEFHTSSPSAIAAAPFDDESAATVTGVDQATLRVKLTKKTKEKGDDHHLEILKELNDEEIQCLQEYLRNRVRKVCVLELDVDGFSTVSAYHLARVLKTTCRVVHLYARTQGHNFKALTAFTQTMDEVAEKVTLIVTGDQANLDDLYTFIETCKALVDLRLPPGALPFVERAIETAHSLERLNTVVSDTDVKVHPYVKVLVHIVERTRTIKKLQLSCATFVRPEMLEALKNNRTITELAIKGVDGHIAELVNVLQANSTIRNVELSSREAAVGSFDWAELSALQDNCKLEVLKIFNCVVGDVGAAAIATLLERTQHMMKLMLVDTSIGDDGVESICRAIHNNEALQLEKLDLSGNKFSRLPMHLLLRPRFLRSIEEVRCVGGSARGIPYGGGNLVPFLKELGSAEHLCFSPMVNISVVGFWRHGKTPFVEAVLNDLNKDLPALRAYTHAEMDEWATGHNPEPMDSPPFCAIRDFEEQMEYFSPPERVVHRHSSVVAVFGKLRSHRSKEDPDGTRPASTSIKHWLHSLAHAKDFMPAGSLLPLFVVLTEVENYSLPDDQDIIRHIIAGDVKPFLHPNGPFVLHTAAEHTGGALTHLEVEENNLLDFIKNAIVWGNYKDPGVATRVRAAFKRAAVREARRTVIPHAHARAILYTQQIAEKHARNSPTPREDSLLMPLGTFEAKLLELEGQDSSARPPFLKDQPELLERIVTYLDDMSLVKQMGGMVVVAPFRWMVAVVSTMKSDQFRRLYNAHAQRVSGGAEPGTKPVDSPCMVTAWVQKTEFLCRNEAEVETTFEYLQENKLALRVDNKVKERKGWWIVPLLPPYEVETATKQWLEFTNRNPRRIGRSFFVHDKNKKRDTTAGMLPPGFVTYLHAQTMAARPGYDMQPAYKGDFDLFDEKEHLAPVHLTSQTLMFCSSHGGDFFVAVDLRRNSVRVVCGEGVDGSKQHKAVAAQRLGVLSRIVMDAQQEFPMIAVAAKAMCTDCLSSASAQNALVPNVRKTSGTALDKLFKRFPTSFPRRLDPAPPVAQPMSITRWLAQEIPVGDTLQPCVDVSTADPFENVPVQTKDHRHCEITLPPPRTYGPEWYGFPLLLGAALLALWAYLREREQPAGVAALDELLPTNEKTIERDAEYGVVFRKPPGKDDVHFFIAHRGTDTKDLCKAVSTVLKDVGVTVFLDAFTPTGDSDMLVPLQRAAYGTKVVLLMFSPHFFDSPYTLLELNTFLRRVDNEEFSNTAGLILPAYWNVDKRVVKKQLSLLQPAPKFALTSASHVPLVTADHAPWNFVEFCVATMLTHTTLCNDPSVKEARKLLGVKGKGPFTTVAGRKRFQECMRDFVKAGNGKDGYIPSDVYVNKGGTN